ncbi:MAG: HXXEE domain-containing protein [Sphingobacteriales bacterium]|nr:MAG: HXXEE domain-containing protein [Sphingobacteriales bacterium]
MNFLRNHWYDLGGFLCIVLFGGLYTYHDVLTHYQLLMWLNLASLFLHQLEEYRIAGTFPGMINSIMYKSDTPDRYPLNPNTSLIVNVTIGWTVYLLAALCAERAVWLGLAAILISAGNVIAHIFLFNIKGRTIYNAGMATCWLLFMPCIYFFFSIVYQQHLITTIDYLIGIPLGIVLNVVGILKMINWLADRNTPYIFPARNLLPEKGVRNT